MKQLTLSEAIRLGAMSTTQAFGHLRIRRKGSIFATCAIGAAMYAAECEDGNLYIRFPLLLELAPYPFNTEIKQQVILIITYLNDVRMWPREKIADWVATLEAKQTCTEMIEETVA